MEIVGKPDTALQQNDQTRLTGQSKRHIKCDEARPSCHRCIRTRRTCDGYAVDKSTSTASAAEKNAVTSGPASALSISSYAIPFKVPGSQKDRQILHYFCVRGGPEIASHFNVEFWTNTVLQQSHQHPVVRQALVALSSLHLDFDCTTAAIAKPDHTKQGALAQYGKAIHSLRRQIDKPDRNTIKAALTCCILFCCFENALGNSEPAKRHLNSGLDLLSTHWKNRGLDHDDQLDALVRVFDSLDLQATIFFPGRVPRLQIWFEEDRDKEAFLNLDEAYGAFTRLQTSLLHFLTTQIPHKFFDEGSLPPHVAEQKRLFEDRFRVWLARFEKSDFTGDGDKCDPFGAQLLLIRCHVSKMILAANCPINERVFGDSPNPRVERILDMAEELFCQSQRAKERPDQKNAGPWRSFSSEVGIVAPLFTLAARCSDDALSERAVELLTRAQRREGLYDSGTMAEVVHQFRKARRSQVLEKLNVRDDGLTPYLLNLCLNMR